MVVQEVPQHRNIGEDRVLRHTVVNIPHCLPLLKGILELVVHGVVESGVEWPLISRDIIGVSVKHLSHRVDSSRFGVVVPEALGDFGGGVDSKTVKLVFLYRTLNPGSEGGVDKRICLVEVWEVGESAYYYLQCVCVRVCACVHMCMHVSMCVCVCVCV